MDVDSTPVAGTWWRHIPAGADVHYEPPDPADNRWQRGAVVEALYFSDSEPTAWAEWYRWSATRGSIAATTRLATGSMALGDLAASRG